MAESRSRSKSRPAKQAKVVFRQDWNIGKAAAESDAELLKTCFVDNGLSAQLEDTNNNASIILGRVGAGKSALLAHVSERQEHVTRIDPSLFSIRYISNSNALQFVAALGVKLDPVFQALWKHVLCVEYIKMRFNIRNRSDAASTWAKLTTAITFNEAKRKAYEYFREFGGIDFWKTTEVRLKEIDQKLESKLTSDLMVDAKVIKAGAQGAKTLSESQRLEIIDNAKSFISNIQMASLQSVVEALAEYQSGGSNARYYIIIDDLDTDWADTELRHRLIRALIESIRRFRPIRQLKILVAMRTDLLQSVISTTRDSGFQAEKLEDFFIRISWTDRELKELLDSRINTALKAAYTRSAVNFQDVFPKEVRKQSTLDYILERTLRRPRDVILFINETFKVAAGRVEMTPALVQTAYRSYSFGRRISLLEEWNDIYPDLDLHLGFLSGLRTRTVIRDILPDRYNNFALKCMAREGSADPVTIATVAMAARTGHVSNIFDALPSIRLLCECIYNVGAVGFILPPASGIRWAGNQMDQFAASSIDLDATIVIHPMLVEALGINASSTQPFQGT